LFKVSLVVIGESVTFPGSKDILDKFAIPWIDLADDRSISMMKNWRSIPANERLLARRHRQLNLVCSSSHRGRRFEKFFVRSACPSTS